MGSRESMAAGGAPGLDAVVRVLQASWPVMIRLTPVMTGIGANADSVRDFLNTMQMLIDSGLVTYEAVVVGTDGPEIVDAALTARGRAQFGPPPAARAQAPRHSAASAAR